MESAIAHVIEEGEQRTSDVAAGSVSFDELHLQRDILKGLRSHRFLTPTKIQAAAIPMVLAGMDLLVQSKSGTGKTLIYVLAALQMVNKGVAKPQVLIIVPTRELAIQVEDTANGLAQQMRNRKDYLAVSYIGGTDVTKDRARMARGRIVVGTPGRLMHLVQNKVFFTSAIRLVVLDEVDQLYATESLRRDVQTMLEALSKCQMIACSATYPNGLDERLAKQMNKPVLVSNSERATVLLGVRQFVYELPEQVNSMQEMLAKLRALHKIFGQLPYEQSILFASSQSRADSFCSYLQREGVECELMSGAMKQSERLETFQAYRSFKMRTLVATDLMARGVDSSHANLVINLDIPKDLVTYLHRIGRAGRFGSKGIAITFVSSPQQSQKFRRLIAEAGTGMSVLQFPTEPREGFDFWNYDAYDFPYFLKAQGHEQADAELKRIKQRWKDAEQAEDAKDAVGKSQQNLANEVAAEQVVQAAVAPKEQLPITVEQESNRKVQLKSCPATLEVAMQVEDKAENISQQHEAEQPKNQNDVVETEANQQQEKVPHDEAKAPATQTSLIEITPSTEELAMQVEDKAESISQQHEAEQPKNQNDVAEAEANQQQEKVPQIEAKAPATPMEAHASLLEIKPSTEELATPSIEELPPAAAPNSINTKTYCLMAPTERSSTTLHPQAVSNTVDDASSIVSDSMDNDYDTDGSYCSYYSLGDAHIIWQRAQTQRRLQQRRQRSCKRRVCIFNWRSCNITSYASKVKRAAGALAAPDDDTECSTLKNPTLIARKLKRLPLLRKFCNVAQIQQLLRAHIKRARMTLLESDELLDQLYAAMQHLYYADHRNAKTVPKLQLPKSSSNLQFEKELGEFFSRRPGEELQANASNARLNKLSVHVNQALNIPPVVVVAPHDSDDDSQSGGSSHSNSSLSQHSEHDSSGSESPEPYSSSGFVESDESASSGIETSQYDSDSSRPGNSDSSQEDESEEEEDESQEEEEQETTSEEHDNEATSTESQSNDSSMSTLTAENEDNEEQVECEDENESEDEDENSEAEAEDSMNAAASQLALAQARWQNQFQMQYRFIANYVDNYMASCRRHY
ncbi:hypothetical protein KR222_006952 [Zaprionus bogoriensis]|nr:hypothetical protein KR222_006952 [Zaprionus bogoriensis]